MIIVAVVIGCFYVYKTPVISTQAALIHAEKYLLNPPEEWGDSIVFNGLEGIPEENIRVNLSERQGLWHELMNSMQWEVTIKSPENESTVIMDAHTGECIEIIGAFS